jgi:hypothetical protein
MDMMLKKFQKDVTSLSFSKIFKRHFFMTYGKNKVLTKKVLIKAGLKETKAELISNHPMVITEFTDGSGLLTNLTSSKKVNGELTIPVGYKKNNETSYFVNESEFLESNDLKSLKSDISENIEEFSDIKNMKNINETASNISEHIEQVTGKELKCKSFESIKLIEPIDKI